VKANEAAFESSIEAWLLEHGGYLHGDPARFDPRRGLDLDELLRFIEATQADEWDKLRKLHGGTEEVALGKFADRLAHEIDDRGTVDVLRHGVVDHGVTIRLAFFKPAHGLTPELGTRYAANRLTVVRQLPFDPDSNKTLDLCLMVNGVPVATAELKNLLTGQTVEHAMAQYRKDRDPENVTLGRRALVHFAVDPEAVSMTTRVAGSGTEFLPFNLGNTGGAGNPPNPDGHRTAYLWERVWQRDAWLDLLARFVHVEMPTSGTKLAKAKAAKTIFPRYHQWDTVLNVTAHARAHGADQRYLVQHSAGSGKSNTIAWLAHRLSTLHDDADHKIFDKVVVITDRVVLDRQLQETIYQFEHAHGVVEKIDKDSQQLADALAGEQARIIITTLQKFPFVLDKVEALPARSYAVLVDEAHSSQTGEAAKEMKAVLGGSDDAALTAAETADVADAASRGDGEDLLAASVQARGRQANLSFFAFTATPKARTLELFGTHNPATDRYQPFSLYTMRQAIEEGFILDVLANYTTYDTYFRIEKAVADDPEYQPAKAKAAIARFVSLHPHNLAQKAEVIVEHFRAHTATKIAGRAKAMVVTSSRLHAVRYKQALDRYIAEKNYPGIHALVAFSGTVIDDGLEFTEANMNGFPESQTAQQFNDGDYQVMVVAEKFQTGYDQPLLHTMFVDKPLQGLYVVQTLSRLNRIYPEKTDTFVLDFRNNIEDIQDAFKPYYDATIAVPTDPNLLYDTHRDLDTYGVLRPEEADEVAVLLLSADGAKHHPRIHVLLDLAIERFNALDDERQDEFRGALKRYLNVYGFLAQIVSFADTVLERDYLYGRALAAVLPSANVGKIDLGSEVELTHLRIEQTFSGRASLDEGSGEVATLWDGRGPRAEPEPEHLSHIVEIINERFGLHLGPTDKLLFDQFEETWVSDPDLTAQAQHNDIDNFRLAFDRRFMHTIVTRMDDNEAIFKKILDDDEFRAILEDFYARKIYERLRAE
jgi:type I restriction enzyme, R subunit